jgi:hypothetical protein
MGVNVRYHWYLLILVQLIVSCLLIVACDWSIRRLLDNVQQARLNQQAGAGTAETARQISLLKTEVSEIEKELNHRLGRRLPKAEELRSLAASFGLTARRFERLGTASKSESGKAKYAVAISGKPLNLIPFLHDLWTNYLLQYDQMALQRSSDAGDQVTLTMTCQVATK